MWSVIMPDELNLEKDLAELEDMKEKAEKVFAMSPNNTKVSYVLQTLQDLIDVVKGGPVKDQESTAKRLLEVKSEASSFLDKFGKIKSAAVESKEEKPEAGPINPKL